MAQPAGLDLAKDTKQPKDFDPAEPAGPQELDQFEGGDEEQEENDPYDDEGQPFYAKVVNRNSKASIWFFLTLGLCIMRAASTFVIIMAFFSLISRAVQIVGFFIPKQPVKFIVSAVGVGITAFFYFLMLGSALVIG